LIAEFFIEKDGKYVPIYISTSHFEGETNAREKQFKSTFEEIFKKEKNCIVLGDYNIGDQNTITTYGFNDVIYTF
jgi:hypothetical protein